MTKEAKFYGVLLYRPYRSNVDILLKVNQMTECII